MLSASYEWHLQNIYNRCQGARKNYLEKLKPQLAKSRIRIVSRNKIGTHLMKSKAELRPDECAIKMQARKEEKRD